MERVVSQSELRVDAWTSGGCWTRASSRSSPPTATAGNGRRGDQAHGLLVERYGEAPIEVLFNGSAMPWVC